MSVTLLNMPEEAVCIGEPDGEQMQRRPSEQPGDMAADVAEQAESNGAYMDAEEQEGLCTDHIAHMPQSIHFEVQPLDKSFEAALFAGEHSDADNDDKRSLPLIVADVLYEALGPWILSAFTLQLSLQLIGFIALLLRYWDDTNRNDSCSCSVAIVTLLLCALHSACCFGMVYGYVCPYLEHQLEEAALPVERAEQGEHEPGDPAAGGAPVGGTRCYTLSWGMAALSMCTSLAIGSLVAYPFQGEDDESPCSAGPAAVTFEVAVFAQFVPQLVVLLMMKRRVAALKVKRYQLRGIPLPPPNAEPYY